MISAPIYGKPDLSESLVFEIKKIQGSALVKLPFHRDWTEVGPGQILPIHSLLQVPKGSSTTLLKRQKISGREKVQMLVINQPTVIRLDESLFRSVEKEKFYISRLPKIDTAPEGKDKWIDYNFSDAWQKLMALVSKPPPNAKLKEPEQPINLTAEVAKPIIIYDPMNGDFFKTPEFPYQLQMLWENVVLGINYYVYIWPNDMPQPEPVLITDRNQYVYEITKPGSYHVQIVSEDQSWQSKVHLVHVFDFDYLSQAKKKDHKSEKAKPEQYRVSLTFPPDRMLLFSKVTPITFAWIGYQTNKDRPQYILEIFDTSSKRRRKVVSDHQQMTVHLEPGQYTWSVTQIQTRMGVMTIYKSEKNLLSVYGGANRNLASQTILKALTDNKGSVIYLD
jgi:hypothetical protein